MRPGATSIPGDAGAAQQGREQEDVVVRRARADRVLDERDRVVPAAMRGEELDGVRKRGVIHGTEEVSVRPRRTHRQGEDGRRVFF